MHVCVAWNEVYILTSRQTPLSTSSSFSIEKCVFHYHFHVLCLQSFYKHLQHKFPVHNIFSEEIAEKSCVCVCECIYLFVAKIAEKAHQTKWSERKMKKRRKNYGLKFIIFPITRRYRVCAYKRQRTSSHPSIATHSPSPLLLLLPLPLPLPDSVSVCAVFLCRKNFGHKNIRLISANWFMV